jgi:hypothetical protein
MVCAEIKKHPFAVDMAQHVPAGAGPMDGRGRIADQEVKVNRQHRQQQGPGPGPQMPFPFRGVAALQDQQQVEIRAGASLPPGAGAKQQQGPHLLITAELRQGLTDLRSLQPWSKRTPRLIKGQPGLSGQRAIQNGGSHASHGGRLGGSQAVRSAHRSVFAEAPQLGQHRIGVGAIGRSESAS